MVWLQWAQMIIYIVQKSTKWAFDLKDRHVFNIMALRRFLENEPYRMNAHCDKAASGKKGKDVNRRKTSSLHH